MRERDLQAKVVRYLRTVPGLWYAKINDSRTAGIPDIVICYKGRFVAIELKVGRNKPTKLQRIMLERIGDAGGLTLVAYSLEEVKKFIGKIY